MTRSAPSTGAGSYLAHRDRGEVPVWLALAVAVAGLAVAFWMISETLLVYLFAVAG